MTKKILLFVCVLVIIPVLVMAQPQNTAQSHPGRNIVIVLSRILMGLQGLVDKLFVGPSSGIQPNNPSVQTKATSTQNYEHAVFNLGQEFLRVADEQVISDQIRILSQEQLNSTKGIVQSINNIQNRSRLETFIFGPDYMDLNQIDQEVNRIGNKIIELNGAAEQTATSSDRQALQNQIGQLTQQKTQLDNFINENKNVISLFGLIRGVLGF
ncbi:MAG: hypothetical protein CO002_03380 [Candidatus Portnoybacteria bacterium CG_4_8_14_3_um_filter_44_10]|uniref:DUF5667 domain-containing protein n=5 Tax=Candidatus Portnoyibacteriota TaxID=1817913 RepID=A0A2H0KP83_9BACT|nr:MAG: hypothetical protein AUK17_02200 [Parcubacteria group bacterium CG2_30_44_18]PIQ73971.1 MAG: hypothetical protein COV85_04635 [Candidatus Portnoybacteria bacterium CG11_big_fil_rev_8_21_14_0_20_44_10]PIS17064.1 MAG: hypothetical protein COT61_00575 [Candidatus Portnoybacteria bacterium CG09_land_8_20_14_0_10_44_13]PIW75189.1 MAG: hypothetical protein CO002_03380 [Candidatus Portnoybacteria bacterium CG_4_8_14_3_um_filter_44_10]PIZ68828.1 MAG: hypothetical protein COY11_05435 [Candidatus